MNLSHRLARHPTLTTALTEWSDPQAYTDAGTLRQAIRDLDLGVPQDFLTTRMIGMVLRIAGVEPVRTSKGTMYLGIRPK